MPELSSTCSIWARCYHFCLPGYVLWYVAVSYIIRCILGVYLFRQVRKFTSQLYLPYIFIANMRTGKNVSLSLGVPSLVDVMSQYASTLTFLYL